LDLVDGVLAPAAAEALARAIDRVDELAGVRALVALTQA